MDKISKKALRPDMPASPASTSSPKTPSVSGLSKWIPLICAGSAIGVSLFALKEIKNTRKELSILKKEGFSASPIDNSKLEKKMELFEDQLKTITTFLKNNQHTPAPVQRGMPVSSKKKKEPEIKPVFVEPEEIVIINESYDPEEYEEVEVTDSESED